jgi:hypothetical protein
VDWVNATLPVPNMTAKRANFLTVNATRHTIRLGQVQTKEVAVPVFRRLALVECVVIALVAALLVALLLPALQDAPDSNPNAWARLTLKQIGVAFHEYYNSHGQLPPAVVRDKGGRTLYSWRVLLLPLLEEADLSQSFNLGEPWDSPHNKPLAAKTPRCYLPSVPPDDAGERGLTHYQVFVGPGTAFERDGLTFQDFPDGPSNTLLVVETREAVPWSKPADLEYDPA